MHVLNSMKELPVQDLASGKSSCLRNLLHTVVHLTQGQKALVLVALLSLIGSTSVCQGAGNPSPQGQQAERVVGLIRADLYGILGQSIPLTQQVISEVLSRRLRNCLEMWDPVEPYGHSSKKGTGHLIIV